MLNLKEIKGIIEKVECAPWEFQLECVLCVRHGFELTDDVIPHHDHSHQEEHVLYIQAKLWRKDTDSDEFGWGYGGKYFLSPHMTEGEIVKKCFVAARDYAEHEVREAFMYEGKRLLGPHIDIRALMMAADILEVRESANW